MKENEKEGIELFADLLTELGNTNQVLSDTIHIRVVQAYKHLTDDVFDKITENQREGKKYVVQLREPVRKLHIKSMLLLGRFDISVGVFKFMEKEPDEYRAEIVHMIRRQLDSINTFLYEFRSLPKIQKKI